MVPVLFLFSLQQWNSDEARSLIDRAIERRRSVEAGLVRYSSTARGVVLFQAQLGPGSDAPVRLIKADELAVEVYWEAPNRSKQTVTAWRERRFLPTDIQYHRDHLGIVTDDFGDRIRLGDGDEVRDVPHPLAPDGFDEYEFALGDSLALSSGTARISVREVLVRPRDVTLPRAAGTLYLEAGTADLVRFRFSFTSAAYLQSQLEDITVVLERALFERSFWLPWRQQIEIRRRLSWLNFPLRTIIRGRWEIDDYDLSVASAPARLAGGPYGGLRAPRPDTGWAEPLDSAVARAGSSAPQADLAEARAQVAGLITAAARASQPPRQLALGSLSDLGRVNRVEGLAIGLGGTIGWAGGTIGIEPRLGYGFSNRTFTGGGAVWLGVSRLSLRLGAERQVRDMSEWPVISGVLNTLLSQERGRDYGDWVLLDRGFVGLEWRDRGTVLALDAARERPRSLDVIASPARGEYRENPDLGGAAYWSGRLALQRGITTATFEAGSFDGGYVRATLESRLRFALGPGAVELWGRGGWSEGGLPVWKTFVLGGRGTLPGESYREFGGQRMALARMEWRLPVTLPTPPLGSWVQAGSAATFAPFVAIGWSGDQAEGLPWRPTDGLRPVLGVASELLFNVLRIEAGWALRAGRIMLLLDASPSWWPVL